MKKKEKNDQLLVKINKEVKKKFIELCEKDDTTASREVRRFIESYIEGFIDEWNQSFLMLLWTLRTALRNWVQPAALK